MKRGRWIRYPLALALSGALVLIVGVSTVRETYREWKVNQEIDDLESQIAALEDKKSSLTELVRRLGSDDAVDLEARARLGLRKEGERVIVLRGGADDAADSWLAPSDSSETKENNDRSRSNPERWLRYFFPVP